MKIQSIETIALKAPDALRRFQSVHAVLRIRTDEGAVGIGRIYPGAQQVIDDQLGPLLIGENPLNVERLWDRMYRTASQYGGQRSIISTIGAIDIALWDLAGKILGCPVHRLLGGYRDEIQAYADGGMFGRGPAGHAEWTARSAAAGFSAIKYHCMGEGPDEIVETVRQMRAAVGPDRKLMVDVHRQWDPRLAVETAHRLEQYDVFWLEEPIAWDDQVRGMAILAASTPIAIAAGESECSLYVCRDLVEQAGIRVLQTDIISAGGYTGWKKLAALAQAFHVKVSPHGASFPELAAPLVAAVPNGLMVSAFPQGDPIELWSRIYREPMDLRGGTIYLRDRPGLGLDLDEKYLAANGA